MLLDDTFAGSFGVCRVFFLHDCGVPGVPEWPLYMQLSARVIAPTLSEARVSHISMAPSLPPVAKTAESFFLNAAVFTDRVCPLKVRVLSNFASRTSHSLAVWSPDAEINFIWPGIHSRSNTALRWHCWPRSARSLSGTVFLKFVFCKAIFKQRKILWDIYWHSFDHKQCSYHSVFICNCKDVRVLPTFCKLRCKYRWLRVKIGAFRWRRNSFPAVAFVYT